MSVNNKHLATILLGAAAAYGAYKYSKLSDEEKQKLADSVKDKFHKLKGEAEKAGDTAKEYFSNLKGKASEMFKDHFPGSEKHFDEFFDENATASNTNTANTNAANTNTATNVGT